MICAGLGYAQTSDEIELTRTVVETQRKAIVAANMKMTETESQAFWPVYNEYQQELRTISDRKIALIKLFAQDYEILTDDQAKAILEEYLDIQSDHLKLRKAHLNKFQKVLPPKLVTRFYQIENKLQAIIDYDLAGSIPLVR
jgi:phosphoglycolate phosphatase-like HAD superfamily hydrolase